MTGEIGSVEAKMDPAVYDELYQKFFEGRSIGVERYISGDLEASRRKDIEDSYGRYRETIDKLFPDQDEGTKKKILAICTFFERMGCESGIKFAGDNRAFEADGDASFRRRVTEYGLR